MYELKWSLLVITAWFFASAMFYWFGGWRILTKRFRAGNIKKDGQDFEFASGSILMSKQLPVNCKNCLYFRVTDKGFLLSFNFPFNLFIFSPSIFIPWEQVESITKHSSLYYYDTVVRIYDSPVRIAVDDRVAPSIVDAYEKYLKPC